MAYIGGTGWERAHGTAKVGTQLYGSLIVTLADLASLEVQQKSMQVERARG